MLEQRQRQLAERSGATCNTPKPSENARFIAVSGYEGAALSTVAVSGLDDVTKVATIEIEPGETPLFVLVASHEQVIWDVVGDTDRIEAFVSQAGGVVGLPKAKVHFVSKNACFQSVSSVSGTKGKVAYAAIKKNIGTAPNAMLAHYTLSRISLPSGTAPKARGDGDGVDVIIMDGKRFEITPEGLKPLDRAEDQLPGNGPFGAARTMRSLLRFHPGGLREMAVANVLAASEAVAYDVLPQEAGLLQLLLDGRVELTRDGKYLITKQIPRFPAGLYGAHSVKFILAEGLEMPKGTPGHSSVEAQDGSRCLSRLCLP